MVQKKIKKGKSLKGKSGREAVKHATGTAAQHISRTRAIRRLQISLKDFRRLCILKGVYPRDPKKKRDGRDKTYYHVKDIAYLQHEPLLAHFRQLKVFLRKYKRAEMKGDEWRVRQLDERRPVFTLHHLLRERYPQFYLALNDMDDALNLLHLFDLLPTQTKVKHFTLDYANTIHALLNELCTYVIHTHSLTKSFITIKGIYFQADIDGVRITWLAPYRFTQHLPEDVDYRVMFTFVQFYVVLVRFVHFKLYHDAQLVYPPRVDTLQLEEGYDLSSTHVEVRQIGDGGAARAGSGGAGVSGEGKKAGEKDRRDEKLQKRVNAVVKGLNGQAETTDDTDQVSEEATEGDRKAAEEQAQAADTATFNAIDPPSAASADYDKRRTLFSACTFYLSREVPFRPLELVIRSAGGTIATSTGSDVPAGVTHYVTDRARLAAGVVGGDVHVVQPQWVFDSFNLRVLAPVSLYRLGVLCPPHLSPFVEEAEGEYQPKQLAVQRGWQAGRAGEVRGGEEEGEQGQGEKGEGEGGEEEMDEEERYEAELQKEMEERKQSTDEDAEDEQEGDDEDEDEVDGEEDEDDEPEDSDEEEDEDAVGGEGDEDEENEEQQVEEEKQAPAVKTAKRQSKAEREEEEGRELAKIMMNKKNARLYQRIQYGLARKEEANETLRQKRDEAEKSERAAAEVKGKGRVKRGAVVEQQQPAAVAKRKRV